jgi:hypothetical protein
MNNEVWQMWAEEECSIGGRDRESMKLIYARVMIGWTIA